MKGKYILVGALQEFEKMNINKRVYYSKYWIPNNLNHIEERKDLIDKSIKNIKISLREIRLDRLLSK